jgi:hypothetical protein
MKQTCRNKGDIRCAHDSARSSAVVWRLFRLYLQEEDGEKYPNKKELYHEAICWCQKSGGKKLALKHDSLRTAALFIA